MGGVAVPGCGVGMRPVLQVTFWQQASAGSCS